MRVRLFFALLNASWLVTTPAVADEAQRSSTAKTAAPTRRATPPKATAARRLRAKVASAPRKTTPIGGAAARRTTAAGATSIPSPQAFLDRWNHAGNKGKLCLDLTGFRTGAFEGCTVELMPNGKVASIVIVTDCGGELCDVHTWLLPESRQLFDLGQTEGPFAATADLRYVFYSASFDSTGLGLRDGELRRIDVRTRTTKVMGACAAPVLSPDDRYVLCRRSSRDVAVLPVDGGKLEVLVPGDKSDESPWSQEGSIAAPRVVFLDARTFSLTRVYSDRVKELRYAWSEGRRPRARPAAPASAARRPGTAR